MRAEVGSIGQHIWAKARAESDFGAFEPVLQETIELNQEMAECIGYDEHPYDALMFRFEPGETVTSLQPLFASLREGLLPLVRAIGEQESPRVDFLERSFPVEEQLTFAGVHQRHLQVEYVAARGLAGLPLELPAGDGVARRLCQCVIRTSGRYSTSIFIGANKG